MSRMSIFDSSETGRIVTEYGKLSVRELEQRIVFYEKKYGTTYPGYNRQFDCDSALPWETSDRMDWENLVEERKARVRKPTRKREMASPKRKGADGSKIRQGKGRRRLPV